MPYIVPKIIEIFLENYFTQIVTQAVCYFSFFHGDYYIIASEVTFLQSWIYFMLYEMIKPQRGVPCLPQGIWNCKLIILPFSTGKMFCIWKEIALFQKTWYLLMFTVENKYKTKNRLTHESSRLFFPAICKCFRCYSTTVIAEKCCIRVQL